MLGDGDTTTVLLHGLAASGDSFGGAWDRTAENSRLIVPDLLGFGRSMDTARTDFSLEAHLGALDNMVSDAGAADTPLVVVGHSMGAVLALHWAARRRNTRKAVAFCPPLYTSHDEAAAHIAKMGPLERLFAFETPLARHTCALMCRFRGTAQWVSVAVSPQWPVAMARQGVLHTWPSYLGGMNGIIQQSGWDDALAALDDRGVPVVLADGARDPILVLGRHDELARRFASVQHVEHPVAGHDLPIAYPDWSMRLVQA